MTNILSSFLGYMSNLFKRGRVVLKKRERRLLLFLVIALAILFANQKVEAAPPIPVASNSKTAADWNTFSKWMKDPSVDEIKLTANILANGHITTINFPKRNLTIDGQGIYRINMLGYYMDTSAPATVEEKSLITVKDIAFEGGVNHGEAIFYPNNNDVHFHNVKSKNRAILFARFGSTVYFSGNTNLDTSDSRTTAPRANVSASSVIVEDNFLVNSLTVPVFTSPNVDANISIENSMFTAKSNGEIFNLNTPTIFNVSNNSTIKINKANNFIKTNEKLFLGLNNAKLDIIEARFIVETVGVNGIASINSQDSQVTVEQGGGFYSGNTKIFSIMNNSHFYAKKLKGSFFNSRGIESSVTSSSIKIDSVENNFIVVNTGSGNSKLEYKDSEIFLRQDDKLNGSMFAVDDQNTILNFDRTNIDSRTSGRLFSITSLAKGSKIDIVNGSVWQAYSKYNNVIKTGSDIVEATEAGLTNIEIAKLGTSDFQMLLDGKGTKINLTGDSTKSESEGGILGITGPRSKIVLNNEAYLSVKSLNKGSIAATSAILITAPDGGFYLNNKSTVDVENTAVGLPVNINNQEAAIRFRIAGSMNFEVDNGSILNVLKSGVSAGVRMYGGNNKVLIKNASQFYVHNKGDGKASNGGMAGNMAVQFLSSSSSDTKNQFIISGEDSIIKLVADYGLAIDGSADELDIIADVDSQFVARGNTASKEKGIFNAKKMTIDFKTMKYFDFANSRTGGGNLFSSSDANSSLTVDKTKLAMWTAKVGSNIMLSEPDKKLVGEKYKLTGNGLNTFVYGSNEMNMYLNSVGGIKNISRMTGNNQRPIITDLRQPTNADKYIWARAVIPEEISGLNRFPYENEVYVKAEIRNPDNSVAYVTEGASIGDSSDGSGVSVYGDSKKKGFIKIPIPNGEFIKSGQTVHVHEAWIDLGMGEKLFSLPKEINVPDVSVIDVEPPKEVMVSPITNADKQLNGTSQENGVKVFVKINEQWLKDKTGQLVTTTVTNHSWTLNLPTYLNKEDKVEVYLKDHSQIETLPTFSLPETYTQEPDQVYGNLNRGIESNQVYEGYHDALDYTQSGGLDQRFDTAISSGTVDVIPVPKLVQSVVSSGGESTSYGDFLTYTFTVSNTAIESELWKNVVLKDYLDIGLDFDFASSSMTIDGVAATKEQFHYDSLKRELVVQVGDLQKNQTKTVVFKVIVSNQAELGKNILNSGIAIGDSPQEDPFILGPSNPENTHKQLSVNSNEVGIPGSGVYGGITFISVPETMNFGTLSYSGETKRIEKPHIKNDLAINDIRENVNNGWHIRAELTQPMKNIKGKELKNSIRYVYRGRETILDKNSQIVFTNVDAVRGSYTISDSWGDTKDSDGVKLHLEASDNIYVGEYTGIITWKLLVGQP